MCVCVRVPSPSGSGIELYVKAPRFGRTKMYNILDGAGISISLFASQQQSVTADLKIIALLNVTAVVLLELNELGNLFLNSIKIIGY